MAMSGGLPALPGANADPRSGATVAPMQEVPLQLAPPQPNIGSGKARTQAAVVAFLPGKLGMTVAGAEGDEVTKVVAGGQAHYQGIQVGWYISVVNDQPYTQDLLQKCIRGSKHYTVTFDKALIEDTALREDDSTKAFAAHLHGTDLKGGVFTSRKDLWNYLDRRRGFDVRCRMLPVHFLFYVLFFCIVVLHCRVSTGHGLSRAVVHGLSRPVLDAADLNSSLRTWFSSRANQALVAPWAVTIGGARVKLLPEATGEADGDWKAAEKENGEVLCSYTKYNFLYDCLRGTWKDANPRICKDGAMNGTTWLHWPLREADALNSALLTAANRAGGVELQILARGTQVDFYALFEARLRFDASGLPSVEEKSTAFSSKPLWSHPSRDMADGGERAVLMILEGIFLVLVLLMFLLRIMFASFGVHHINSINLCVTSVLVILYANCDHLTRGLNEIVSDLPVVSENRQYSSSEFKQTVLGDRWTWQKYERKLDSCLEQARRVADSWDELYWCMAVLTIFMTLHLVQALRANPRLRITVRTACKAASEFLHLFVAFAAIISAFVLIGYVVFGSRIEAFSTAGSALETTLFILGGSLYDDYRVKMNDAGGPLGIIWVWLLHVTFSIACVYVVFAVLLDAYRTSRAEISKESGGGTAATLLEQTHRLLADGGPPMAARNWSEKRLHAELRTGAHPSELVHSRSLAEAVGARSWDEHVQLDQHVARAGTASAKGPPQPAASPSGGPAAEASTLTDSARLYGRIDANVQQLGSQLQHIESLLGNMLAKSPRSHACGDEIIDLSTEEILELHRQETLTEMRAANPESVNEDVQETYARGHAETEEEQRLKAERECIAEEDELVAIKALVEAGVRTLEDADAKRCTQLGDQLRALENSLKTLQGSRIRAAEARKDAYLARLYMLETTIDDLFARFADFEQIESDNDARGELDKIVAQRKLTPTNPSPSSDIETNQMLRAPLGTNQGLVDNTPGSTIPRPGSV